MMENNKGITLMSLAIMIVILLILATIGINYSLESFKFATLTKIITEFEIINTQISILNQNKNYQSEYVNYGLDETEEELISQINNLLEGKLVDVYNISTSDLSIYKARFQYCSANNIKEKLGIDEIEGSYLVNIHNKIVISFNAINYRGKKYYTLEELEKDGLAKTLYKGQYYKHENPYIPQGYYYAGGTWDTGYIIGDSIDDKYTGDVAKILTKEMVEEYRGNLYMWIPIEEKSDNNENGIDWSVVTSDTDYTNIQSALDTYKTTYIAPEYSSQWYTIDDAEYAYSDIRAGLVKYSSENSTEEDTNNLLSSIYLKGGLYIKIQDAKKETININGQDGLFIANVTLIDSKNTNKTKIISINKTTLHSNIALSTLTTNTYAKYKITVYNSTDTNYCFYEAKYDSLYTNSNIEFQIEGIEEGNFVNAGEYKTFYITFKYNTDTVPSKNTLESYIDFVFKKAYRVTYENITNNKYPGYAFAEETFTVAFGALDASIEIKLNGNALSASKYTYSNYTLTIPNTSGNIHIRKLKNYTIVNLVKNGSFENNFNNWGVIGDSSKVGIVKIPHLGEYAAYRTANGAGQNFLVQDISWVEGHKYYLFGYAISVTPQTFACNVTNRGGGFTVTTSPNYYAKGGSIYTADFPSGNNYISVNYAAITDNVNIDAIGLVDLTAAFGEGNEPDLEWCNININYFDGTTTVSK